MAEHMNWKYQKNVEGPAPKVTGEDGFAAMGKPIPMFRRTAALDHCRKMGLTDPNQCWACIAGMVDRLERDQPYEAMAVGMRYLDLTGTYRLMAVLLTAREVK